MCISWRSTLHSARDSEPGVDVEHPPSSFLLSFPLLSPPPPVSISHLPPTPFSVSHLRPPPIQSTHRVSFSSWRELSFLRGKRGGGSEERRKISFCPGAKEQGRIQSLQKLEYTKQLNWIKEADKQCSPGCQRGEASSLTWSPAYKGLCLSLESFLWTKNKPPAQPTFNCLIAVASKCRHLTFSVSVCPVGLTVWYCPSVVMSELWGVSQEEKKKKIENIITFLRISDMAFIFWGERGKNCKVSKHL